ncbi:unnamed protein product [Pleuronectes platessa]|uniref:Secreted protein n=1 Tax=Pleuronectes platessa TaxID=8262 RepID=A0A9N7UDI7_PLEPL|nr:unnamed protein product [Pleuronectes platessa]
MLTNRPDYRFSPLLLFLSLIRGLHLNTNSLSITGTHFLCLQTFPAHWRCVSRWRNGAWLERRGHHPNAFIQLYDTPPCGALIGSGLSTDMTGHWLQKQQ